MGRDNRGFTLIELLIVVVIIGILAAIAIPKYAATRQKAYVTSMISDLRNMATAEEAYFSDNATYYVGAVPSSTFIFTPSSGVSLVIDAASAGGWSATASSTGTPRQCAVFYGSAAAVSPATVEGVWACTPP